MIIKPKGVLIMTTDDMIKYMIMRLGIEKTKELINSRYPTFKKQFGDDKVAYRVCVRALFSKLGDYFYSKRETNFRD